MPGNTYKGSRNIKGKTRKSSRKSSRNSQKRNSRNSNNTGETFVEAILSDMPKPSVNLTKMDHAMGNRTNTGLINPGNIDYDPLHIQYMVQKSNDMSHLNKYAYSSDQIMGNQMGQPQMMPQMMPQMGQPQMMPQMDQPQMGQPQMMPQMGQLQMMPQMGQQMGQQMDQPMMFGSREGMENMEQPSMEQPSMEQPSMEHMEPSMEPSMEQPSMENMEPQRQEGGSNLVELLADRLRNNSLSSSDLRKLRKILH